MENLPTSEIKMTLLEIARSLNIEDRTVRKYVSKLFPGLMRNGVATYLNEEQVTLLKLDIQQNQHLERSFQLPKTDLEKELLIQQAMKFQSEKIEVLQAQLEDAQPKIEFHDQVGDSEGLYSIGETAKLLEAGRNRFFKRLREEKIFMGTLPYQSFIDRGYFEVKTSTHNGYVQKQAFTTPKGLQWLHKKFTGLPIDFDQKQVK